MCPSHALGTDSAVVDSTDEVVRNPATSNTSGTDRPDTREGTLVVEDRGVEKNT
jgi:hypothetical protein